MNKFSFLVISISFFSFLDSLNYVIQCFSCILKLGITKKKKKVNIAQDGNNHWELTLFLRYLPQFIVKSKRKKKWEKEEEEEEVNVILNTEYNLEVNVILKK